MASTGEEAWKKYFKGKGDIATSLKDRSNLYDDVTGRSLSKFLEKDTEIVYLSARVYETPAKIKYKSNGKYITARVPFNNIQKPIDSGKIGKSKLKPKDVVPSIVDEWLTPDEIVANVKKYLNTLTLPDQDIKAMFMLLDLTIKDSEQSINVGKLDKNLVPSEFFEILTSIKLAVLMRSNNKKIRGIFGVPKKMDLSKCKIKIMIPKQANMPLLDYYVSVSLTNNPDDKVMRVSVKSKVASASTNTIKFNDAFESDKELKTWYNNTKKKDQIGQMSIADSAINAPSGKSLIYPIKALAKLFDVRRDLIKASLDQFRKPDKFDLANFEAAVKTLSNNMQNLVKKSKLETVLKSDKQLNEMIRFMKANLFQKGNKIITDLTVENASFMCEKIVSKATQKELERVGGGMNFYQMFYDQILESRQIAYAVADKTGNMINYKYYSKVNWKAEYVNWVSLRSKNLINNLNDTLGMDI